MEVFVLCLVVVSTLMHCAAADECRLYSKEDNLLCMTNSSLMSTVLESNYSWIVEFYASWCGHCQFFAPKWKEFATSIKNWGAVARVAVIDCGEKENTPSCRHFQVQGFPTLKFFYAHSSKAEVGVQVRKSFFLGAVTPDEKNLNGLRQAVLQHIESQPNPSRFWPLLSPVDNVSSVKQWMLLRTDRKVFLVLENDDSFLGRELMMEMYGRTEVLIRRAVSSQSDVAAFCGIAEFPALILISNGNLVKLKLNGTDLISYKAAVSNSNLLQKLAEDAAADKGKAPPNVQKKKPVLKANKKGHDQVVDQRKPVHSIKPSVYSEDLVATLIFSFHHEIPLHDLSGNHFKTLTRFVEVLSSCLPVPIATRRFLDQLSSRLKLIDLKSKKIDVSTWMRLTSHDNSELGLPADKKWVTCKGSQPHYRGYPCGVWTVFHTALINCARYDLKLQKTCSKWRWQRPQVHSSHVVSGSKRMDIKDILYAIRDYIRDFFGCRQCSENFSKMAVEIPKEVATATDGVLWLWRAHNRVNKRLQDAVSSDPQHPKIQFPSQEQCPHCRAAKTDTNSEIQWDENAILCFLTDMYWFKSIRTTYQVYHRVVTHGQRIRPRISAIADNRRVIDPDIHTPLYYGIDWKFCLFLYFISMVALVFVGRTLMRSRSCRRKRTRFNPV